MAGYRHCDGTYTHGGRNHSKNCCKSIWRAIFSSTLGITNLMYYALYPLVTSFIFTANWVVDKLFGSVKHESTEYVTSEKEIRFLIDYITQKGIMEGRKR